jgi:hypothetical protein
MKRVAVSDGTRGQAGRGEVGRRWEGEIFCGWALRRSGMDKDFGFETGSIGRWPRM